MARFKEESEREVNCPYCESEDVVKWGKRSTATSDSSVGAVTRPSPTQARWTRAHRNLPKP